ncbi:nitroreductase family protein [Streptomyces cacaoi]|uniref:nitroreductase family protein n=1 Tax=Streptomyces cacaoi TaxID=1898 RepID=UPI001E32FDDA|nr:nitroreductase family protein [Streptomyces cacaoi]
MTSLVPAQGGSATASFFDVVVTRRVVRSYASQPIPDEVVDSLVTSMLAAPSGANRQAWAFVTVRSERGIRALRAFAPGIFGTPAMVLAACVDHSRVPEHPVSRGAHRLCVAMAVENFLLAAHAQGLGACPVHSFQPAPVHRLLRLPTHLEPVLVVPVGYPAADQPEASRRRPREEVVADETFGHHRPGVA